jgi:hypothetical protein
MRGNILLNIKIPEILTPEACASRIFEMSGAVFELDMAADLWSKIINHKLVWQETVLQKTITVDRYLVIDEEERITMR